MYCRTANLQYTPPSKSAIYSSQQRPVAFGQQYPTHPTTHIHTPNPHMQLTPQGWTPKHCHGTPQHARPLTFAVLAHVQARPIHPGGRHRGANAACPSGRRGPCSQIQGAPAHVPRHTVPSERLAGLKTAAETLHYMRCMHGPRIPYLITPTNSIHKTAATMTAGGHDGCRRGSVQAKPKHVVSSTCPPPQVPVVQGVRCTQQLSNSQTGGAKVLRCWGGPSRSRWYPEVRFCRPPFPVWQI